MELLWRQHPLTVRDVRAELVTSHPPAYTTVMTVMSRLAEQGLLRREQTGKAYRYEPAVTKEEFFASLAGDIVHDLLRDFGPQVIQQFVSELAMSHRRGLQLLEDELRQRRCSRLAGTGSS